MGRVKEVQNSISLRTNGDLPQASAKTERTMKTPVLKDGLMNGKHVPSLGNQEDLDFFFQLEASDTAQAYPFR